MSGFEGLPSRCLRTFWISPALARSRHVAVRVTELERDRTRRLDQFGRQTPVGSQGNRSVEESRDHALERSLVDLPGKAVRRLEREPREHLLDYSRQVTTNDLLRRLTIHAPESTQRQRHVDWPSRAEPPIKSRARRNLSS